MKSNLTMPSRNPNASARAATPAHATTHAFALAIALVMLLGALLLSACAAKTDEALDVRFLLLPHFEQGQLSGDAVGEAQLLYEEFLLDDAQTYDIQGGFTLYYSPKNEVALCLTGAGKTNAASCLTSVLGDERFDFDETYLIAIGCAGGAIETTTLGDVCLATGVCDLDLGHTADARDLTDDTTKWFHDPSYDGTGYKHLNTDLMESLYEQVKDITLETTEIARKTMASNFDDAEWATRDPQVLLGTNGTSDNYWKGTYDHSKACAVCDYYDMDYPFTMSEMEDSALASVADNFGMLDRFITIRASVNVDVFINGDTPETLWGDSAGFLEESKEENEETLDIFEPAMRNLHKVCVRVMEILGDNAA